MRDTVPCGARGAAAPDRNLSLSRIKLLLQESPWMLTD